MFNTFSIQFLNQFISETTALKWSKILTILLFKNKGHNVASFRKWMFWKKKTTQNNVKNQNGLHASKKERTIIIFTKIKYQWGRVEVGKGVDDGGGAGSWST